MRLALMLSLAACSVQEAPAPAREAPLAATPVMAEPRNSTDPDCDLTASGPAHIRVGEAATMTVSMSGSGEYKLNHEAPFAVGVTSDEVRTSKPRYSLDDATVLAPDAVTVEIPFTAHAPGEHALEIHASFGLCSEADCALCRERRTVTTVVR